MKHLVIVLLLTATTSFGQPLWRNWFTTNHTPSIAVAQGSNTVVLTNVTGDDVVYTVSSTATGGGSGTNGAYILDYNGNGTNTYMWDTEGRIHYRVYNGVYTLYQDDFSRMIMKNITATPVMYFSFRPKVTGDEILSTNLVLETELNVVSNQVGVVSNQLNSFSSALTNADSAILQSATNYAASVANAVSNLAFSLAQGNTNHASTVLQSATNYAASVANAVSNLAYSLATANTNHASGVLQSSTNYTDLHTNFSYLYANNVRSAYIGPIDNGGGYVKPIIDAGIFTADSVYLSNTPNAILGTDANGYVFNSNSYVLSLTGKSNFVVASFGDVDVTNRVGVGLRNSSGQGGTYIGTNGWIGVGTNRPTALLHITGAGSSGTVYAIQVSAGVSGSDVTNVMTVNSNGSIYARSLSTSGNGGVTSGSGAFISSTSWTMANSTIGGTILVYNGVKPVTNALMGYFTSTNKSFLESGFDQANGFCFLRANTNNTGAATATNYGLGISVRAVASPEIYLTTNSQVSLLATNGVGVAQLLSLTNGLQVSSGGDMNPVGRYGALMMNATNIVVCAGAAGVYTNVAGTGYTTIVTNGFYGSTADALTNVVAGWYRVAVNVSALGQNNQATEWEVFTNGVSCDLIGFKKTYDAAARMDAGSMSGIIYLPAGCRTDFRVQDAGTGGSISIHRASLVIGTP